MNSLVLVGSDLVISLDRKIDNLVGTVCSIPHLSGVPRYIVIGGIAVILTGFYIYILPLVLICSVLALVIRNYDIVPNWVSILSMILVLMNYQNSLLAIGVVYAGKEFYAKKLPEKPWYHSLYHFNQ